MRLQIQVDGDLKALIGEELRAGEVAIAGGVSRAGTRMKRAWREQITGSGLGHRLAGSIQQKTYPAGAPSLRAASLVWSKAPVIIGAHDAGPLIRSQNGFYLAVPLPAAGTGARGKRMTPRDWETKTGRELVFIYRRNRPALLVDEGKKAKGNVMVRKRARSGGFELAEPSTFKNRVVPIFVLLPQVKLKKRLNLMAAAEAAAAGLPMDIIAAWRASR